MSLFLGTDMEDTPFEDLKAILFEELLRRAAEGDRACAEEVVRRVSPAVVDYVRTHLFGEGCDDVIQDVGVSIWLAIPKCGGLNEGQFRAVVMKIAQRRKDDHLRRKYRDDTIRGHSLDSPDAEPVTADEPFAAGPQDESEEGGRDIESEARAYREEYMLDRLTWKGNYVPPQPTIRAAILRCRGRNAIRNDPEVAALGLSKRTMETAIPEVRALLREELEIKEIALIYYYQRQIPGITNVQLRKQDGLKHLTDWDFRERKARLHRIERQCEAEIRRRFFGDDPDAGEFAK